MNSGIKTSLVLIYENLCALKRLRMKSFLLLKSYDTYTKESIWMPVLGIKDN